MEAELPLIFLKELTNNTDNEMNVFIDNRIVCGYVHSKFLVIGTESRSVYVYDHLGSLYWKLCLLEGHISMIDIDVSGEYIMICMRPQKISVYSLIKKNLSSVHESEREIITATINPNYSRKSPNSVIFCVNKTVIQSICGMFASKRNVLYVCDQKIEKIKWRNEYVITVDLSAIRIFNITIGQMVLHFNIDEELHTSNKRMFTEIQWSDDKTVFVAIDNNIKILQSRICAANEKKSSLITFDIIQEFKLEYNLLGMGFIPNYMIAFEKLSTVIISADSWSYNVKIHIYTKSNNKQFSYQESQEASIKTETQPKVFRMLTFAPDPSSFFMLDDRVYAIRARNTQDVIEILIGGQKYKEAYEHALNSKEPSLIITMMFRYLEELLKNHELDQSRELIKSYTNDMSMMEKIIKTYLKANTIESIITFIPYSINTRLSPQLYNEVLTVLFAENQRIFCDCIIKWPKSLYDTTYILGLIESNSTKKTKNYDLDRVRAILYSQKMDYIEGMKIYISLKDNSVFEFIPQHNLFPHIFDYFKSLLEMSTSDTLRMCTQYNTEIPVSRVIQELSHDMKLLNTYLSKLYFTNSDLTKPYIDLQIELHAKYSTEHLLNLLRDSTDYDITKALSICKSLNLFDPYAFLCEKNGDLETALLTYLVDLKDVQKGIRMCNRYKNPAFWAILVDMCVKDPVNISKLLTNCEHNLNPVDLIAKIPINMEIDNLKDTISKMLYDSNTKVSLMKNCYSIIISDSVSMLHSSEKNLRLGNAIEVDTKCCICGEILISTNTNLVKDAAIMMCKHAYHSSCLSSKLGREDICFLCMNEFNLYSTQKKTKLNLK